MSTLWFGQIFEHARKTNAEVWRRAAVDDTSRSRRSLHSVCCMLHVARAYWRLHVVCCIRLRQIHGWAALTATTAALHNLIGSAQRSESWHPSASPTCGANHRGESEPNQLSCAAAVSNHKETVWTENATENAKHCRAAVKCCAAVRDTAAVWLPLPVANTISCRVRDSHKFRARRRRRRC